MVNIEKGIEDIKFIIETNKKEVTNIEPYRKFKRFNYISKSK